MRPDNGREAALLASVSDRLGPVWGPLSAGSVEGRARRPVFPLNGAKLGCRCRTREPNGVQGSRVQIPPSRLICKALQSGNAKRGPLRARVTGSDAPAARRMCSHPRPLALNGVACRPCLRSWWPMPANLHVPAISGLLTFAAAALGLSNAAPCIRSSSPTAQGYCYCLACLSHTRAQLHLTTGKPDEIAHDWAARLLIVAQVEDSARRRHWQRAQPCTPDAQRRDTRRSDREP
jgi:hypothetical protein